MSRKITEDKHGEIFFFGDWRSGLRKNGIGAFRAGSGETWIHEFEGAERDTAEGGAGARGVGFLGCY